MVESVGNLDPYYISLVNNIMFIERQPLVRLEDRLDNITLEKSVYSDLGSNLDSLQSSIKSLLSTDGSYSLNTARKAEVTGTGDLTVLSAQAASSALIGSYAVNDISLAQAHRVRSDQQIYSDQPLNLSGSFLLGGAEFRSQSTTNLISNTVIAFDVVQLGVDQPELGSDTYYVETRNDATNGWQFRVVNSDSKAVNINKTDGSDEYTTTWQSIPTGGGAYDTGRGLTFNFGTDQNLYQAANRSFGNAAQLDYTAQGANITVATTDSLQDIVKDINAASFGEGNQVVASIVDKQLILTSAQTGLDSTITAQDLTGTVLKSLGILTVGDGYKNELQLAKDASFNINGVSVIRSSNTGITDVVDGLTINLTPDAEGQSATLEIKQNVAAKEDIINSFVENFNKVLLYLEEKTKVSQIQQGSEVIYKRGILAGESIFGDLRTDLMTQVISGVSNSGQYTYLSEIGLSINDDLQLTVEDTDKLSAALSSNMSDVTSIFDSAMNGLDGLVGRFTGVSGFLQSSVDIITSEKSEIDGQIVDLNDRLDKRKETLIFQFADVQAQIMNMAYMQQQWASIYKGSINLFA